MTAAQLPAKGPRTSCGTNFNHLPAAHDGAQERWYYLIYCPFPSCVRGRPGTMIEKISIPSKDLRAMTASIWGSGNREGNQKPLKIQLSFRAESTSRCPLYSLALMSDKYDALPREEITEQDHGDRLKIQRQPQITKSFIPICLSCSTWETGGSVSSSS